MAKHYTSREVLQMILAKKTEKEVVNDGDKVRLNVKRIKNHPDYSRLSDGYRRFVEENVKTVFTARSNKGRQLHSIFGLEESDEGWLFWSGDLIKVG